MTSQYSFLRDLYLCRVHDCFVSAALLATACFVIVDGGLGAQAQRQVRNLGIGNRAYRPVTDAMLEKPEPGQWINWRRTYDGTGYSPLNQINKQNVGQLKLAWSWGMPAGAHQPTPLVHDGVMFLPTPGGGAQAVDADQRRFPVGVPRAAAERRQRQRAPDTRHAISPSTPTTFM